MKCKKCGGGVYYDSMYQNETFIDLSCLMCGKRWHVPRKNPLGKAIVDAQKAKVR